MTMAVQTQGLTKLAAAVADAEGGLTVVLSSHLIAYQAKDVTLEELVLAYMRAGEASASRHLTTVGEGS
jgi:hypothetical protein